MKYTLLLSFLIPFVGFSQKEFSSDSPFMYDSSTMIQLRTIVDSLNLKFQRCDLNRDFHSKQQAHGWRVILKGDRAHSLNLALASSPSLESIKKEFPEATFIQSVFVKYEYTDYKDNEQIKLFAYPGDVSQTWKKSKGNVKNMAKGKWISSYSDYKNGKTNAYFFEEDFATTKIPDAYSKMIQYVDCMIDTNGIVMSEEAEYGSYQPLPDNYQDLSLDEKKNLLAELRRTRVMGGCSRDQSPRYHARNIAILSAEALEWEIFLRSHLDVMNDRFERVSDGSYAWGQRGTYIGELEEIDLDIVSLMVGISLRMDDPAINHYHGSIPRVSRALAESGELDAFHQLFASMMKDEQLDDYNRILMYYLWSNSISYAPEEKQSDYKMRLDDASQGLPAYFRESLKD